MRDQWANIKNNYRGLSLTFMDESKQSRRFEAHGPTIRKYLDGSKVFPGKFSPGAGQDDVSTKYVRLTFKFNTKSLGIEDRKAFVSRLQDILKKYGLDFELAECWLAGTYSYDFYADIKLPDDQEEWVETQRNIGQAISSSKDGLDFDIKG